MSLSSHNWFKYINEVRLNEGVRDIGLPEAIIDRIEETLPDAAEKAKTWIGNQWKRQRTGDIDRVKTLLGLKVAKELIDNGVFEDTDHVLDVDEKDSENLKKINDKIDELKIDPINNLKKFISQLLKMMQDTNTLKLLEITPA